MKVICVGVCNVNMFSSHGILDVRRQGGKRFYRNNSLTSVKHGGEKILVLEGLSGLSIQLAQKAYHVMVKHGAYSVYTTILLPDTILHVFCLH